MFERVLSVMKYSSANDFEAVEAEKDRTAKGGGSAHNSLKAQSNGPASGRCNNVKESKDSSTVAHSTRNERKNRQVKSTLDTVAEQQKQQDEYCQK